MKTKYIDKEIAILERMEQLEAISQQGLDKLNEFRHLRDLAKGQKLPIHNVIKRHHCKECEDTGVGIHGMDCMSCELGGL